MQERETVLTEELEKFSRQRGADLFGVADLALAKDFVASQSPFSIGHFPRAVSVGMQLIDSIVDLHRPDEPRRQSLYWHHVYEVVTPALDFLAYDLTRWLTGEGFKALPVPGSTPYDFDNLKGFFSPQTGRPSRRRGLDWQELSSLNRPLRTQSSLCIGFDRRAIKDRLPLGPALRKMSCLHRCLSGKSLYRGGVSRGRRARAAL